MNTSQTNPCFLRGIPMLGLLPFIAMFLSGCASVGQSFDYSKAQKLELGQLQFSNYQSVFGKPNATAEQTDNDAKFETARYTYAYANLGSANSRILVLEFKDGKLNAFVYLSSFDGEATPVPSDKVTQITKGVSTKADVQKALGTPNGKALCPSLLGDFKDRCKGNSEIWTWQSISSVSTFGAAYGGKGQNTMTLFVTFDANGIVSGIESATASNS